MIIYILGSFKIRGALNMVQKQKKHKDIKGVLTHSLGNHGAAVAYAGKCNGLKSIIIMPTDAPKVNFYYFTIKFNDFLFILD
jgi:threonine dehydratase